MERLAFVNTEDAHATTMPISAILAALANCFCSHFAKHQFCERHHLDMCWGLKRADTSRGPQMRCARADQGYIRHSTAPPVIYRNGQASRKSISQIHGTVPRLC